MSGFAAIFGLNGAPVALGAVEAMTAAMAYRGPDGIAYWQGDGVALGHCMLRTTAESLEEVQPLANEDASLVLVLDGWLSNWEELRGELIARGARLRDRSDAELVLRAYEAWGDDCPRRIDGEFAFVIWDARKREVFLARDHAGLRPLHYHWDGARLVVASDIGGVLAAPGVPAHRNRGMIAEYIANDWFGRDETVWEGVMRAIPARWMRFNREGVRSGTYWEPPFEVGIRHRSDAEYVEHYRAIYTDCLRRTARSHLPLACDVSGGLDSSANFAVAHDLLEKGLLPAPGLKCYTYRFDNDAEADELIYARAVADHCGMPLTEVAPFLPELDWFVERGREYRDVAAYPNGAMAVSIGERLVADGCRVSLNGEGGDEWLAGKPFYYQEHLAERDWRGLRASLADDLRDSGLRETVWRLMRYGVAPLMPQGLKDLRRRLAGAPPVNQFSGAFWLSPEMRDLHARRRDAVDRQDFMRISNLARRSMYMVLTYVFVGIVRDHIARQSARIGYEIRSPMYARRFIEFAFAVPERMKLRGSAGKFLHVEAMRGLLPALVADRKTKAGFSSPFTRHLDRLGPAALRDLFGVESGMLDPDGLERLYRIYQSGPRESRPVWELWGIVGTGSL